MGTGALTVLVFGLLAATSTMAHRRNSNTPTTADPMVEATNRFTLDLMKTVFNRRGNGIMSPLSVSTLLAMLQQGAKNSSGVQLENILHLNKGAALSGYRGLISSLKNRQSKTVLEFGNNMFVNHDFDIDEEYKESMTQNFHAGVESVEFRYPTTAAKKINDWVSEATRGKISGIVKPEAITGRTEMILTNTIYFKGVWEHTFDSNKTEKLPFFKRKGEPPVTVNMMAMEDLMRAGEDTDDLKAKWVFLQYVGREYAIILLLPSDGGTVEELVNRMTPAHLTYLATAYSVRDVTLRMPRFKLETDVSLVPALQSLGLQDIFNHNSNLEGISTTKTPLVVSDVLHKAQIEVNEEGSEAAASTAFIVNTLSLTPSYDQMAFNANEPFLAIIVDKASSLPLFVAKVSDPTRS